MLPANSFRLPAIKRYTFILVSRFLVVLLAVSCLLLASIVRADEIDDLTKQIGELQKSLEMSQSATTPLEASLKDLERQIAGIQAKIADLVSQLERKKKELAEGEKTYIVKRMLLETRIRSIYKQALLHECAACLLFETSDFSSAVKHFGYQKSVIDDNKEEIAGLIAYIKDLETKKIQYEEETVRLASAKKTIDGQAEFFRKEIRGARDYQAQLGQQIASLTARQQALLAERTGLFQTSVGDVPLADDPASRPDYNPGFSPAFAAFSFGAPHFKGMSQYGAFGRAKNGQNAEEILRAYYGGVEIKKDYSTDITIRVDGHGSYNIEEYTKRIYEMPASWGDQGGMEALKAQAVAARSYALARTNNGAGSICATESCQVFKPEPKGGKWEEAVNATRGWVLLTGGAPFSSMYASTSGGYQESYTYNGYSTPAFWDTKSGRGGWTGEAYEKLAGSPWFYKGWYKTRAGKTCGRSHPWLTSEEFADIVNAAIIYQAGGDMSGVFPVDVGSCYGDGATAWSRDRLREEANKHGGGLSSVSSVSVQYREDGVTGKVIVNGREFDGQKFYKAFNLRAPGAVHLKSGLFNIEKK